jgi:hypothetical protein
MQLMFLPHRKHTWASTACSRAGLPFLYVDYDRTSQETHLWALFACYGDSFTFLYANDIRTSLETYMRLSMAYYGDIFSSFMSRQIELVRLNVYVCIRASAYLYSA